MFFSGNRVQASAIWTFPRLCHSCSLFPAHHLDKARHHNHVITNKLLVNLPDDYFQHIPKEKKNLNLAIQT